jgi:Fic family protein
MRTFGDIDTALAGQPPRLGAVLARVDAGRGREGMYRAQVPELLMALATNARIESIRASTALEGINVDAARARSIADGGPKFRSRSEKEFAGYRDAIDYLIREPDVEREPLSIPLILHLHRLLYQHVDGRGGYLKTEDNQIAVRDDQGVKTIVFSPPPWQETEGLLVGLLDAYHRAQAGRAAHPLVLIGALILDFLAIHPVLDGNGRLARLVTAHELVANGYGVARYISLEQLIYDSKNSYYGALAESQRDWHDATHDPWTWITYLAGVMASAYDLFEQRVEDERPTAGLTKQERVRHWVLHHAPQTFRIADVRLALPGISDPTIALATKGMADEGLIRSNGRGRGATWTRIAP